MADPISRMPHAARRLVELVRTNPRDSALIVAVIAVTTWVVCHPFFLTRYPPLTDLPFHAAQMSIFRNYYNPAFQFRQQFTIHPLDVPYISMYLVGALLAFVMPITWAAKGMTIYMLALLPIGFSVLMLGMKKSPLWALLATSLVWTRITHWGWLSYSGALGLYAAAVGCALLLLDAPSFRRQLLLGGALLAVFFTHVYRMPFALLAVAATVVVMYPATRRIKPVLAPLFVATAVLVAWWSIRPTELQAKIDPLRPDWQRFKTPLVEQLFGSYSGAVGARETHLVQQEALSFAVLGVVCAIAFFIQRRYRSRSSNEIFWGVGVTVLALGLSFGHLVAFTCLPMRIGAWWAVYPRELQASALFLLAAMPDLPRSFWQRVPALALVAFMSLRIEHLVAGQWRLFHQVSWGFRALAARIPPNSKLLYMVFHHDGTAKRDSPFVHLPAWIQAERGAYLSFQFVGHGLYPVRYRTHSDSVPPPFGRDWEWSADRFMQNAYWFDWFLIRAQTSPDQYFVNMPTIHRVAEAGGWYLYARSSEVSQPSARPDATLQAL